MERCRAQIAEAQVYKRELEIIYAAVRSARQEAAGADAVVLSGTQIAHVSQELHAIVGSTEQATQSILKAAEDIDQTAGMLSAALRNGHDQGLAHDIQDRVVQIFEACNFQDLTGQRVDQGDDDAEVRRGARRAPDGDLAEPRAGRDDRARRRPMRPSDEKFLNGPKLAGDSGHSSQEDVDAMFGSRLAAR